MKTVWTAAAVVLGAISAAPLVAAQDPPPAAAPVNSVNLASIKAIFDNAKVPATIKKSGGGVSFVEGELSGYWILAVPADCPGNDQTGACKSLALLSAVWTTRPGLEKIAAFARAYQRFSMPLTTEDGQPLLRYVFSVADGVGPSYVENRMVDFYYEQKEFEQALYGQASTNSGFSVAAGEKAAKIVDSAAALATLPAPHPGGKLAP